MRLLDRVNCVGLESLASLIVLEEQGQMPQEGSASHRVWRCGMCMDEIN